MNVSNLLCEMDDVELYKLLGDAWYAQLQPKPGAMFYLESVVDTGRREFNELRRTLPAQIGKLSFDDAVACANRTIVESGAWRMPATVIAALAIKPGMIPPGVASRA